MISRYQHKSWSRHFGMDSRQAILPVALRVNANLFQTDLCRNPEYKDVLIDITLRPIKSNIKIS
jgi:hypothetical protein